jgi:hypothetical protein
MPSTPPSDRRNITASTHRLQRAADEFQQQAAARDAIPSLPTTLAQIEQAVDRLATGMVKMAQAVTDWSRQSDAIVDDDALPPEVRALCWHLHDVAARLRSSRDACPATQEWARQLAVDAGAQAEAPRASGASRMSALAIGAGAPASHAGR